MITVPHFLQDACDEAIALKEMKGWGSVLKGIETYFRHVPARDDLTIAALLSLSRDIEVHPEMLRAFPVSLAKRIDILTEGVKFDPNAESEGAVAL